MALIIFLTNMPSRIKIKRILCYKGKTNLNKTATKSPSQNFSSKSVLYSHIYLRLVRVPDDFKQRISEWERIRDTWLTSLVSAQGSELLYYYISFFFNLIPMNNVSINHGIRKTILTGIHIIILTCLQYIFQILSTHKNNL